MQKNQKMIYALAMSLLAAFSIIAIYMPIILAIFIPIFIILTTIKKGRNTGVLAALLSTMLIFLIFPWQFAFLYVVLFLVPAIFLGWLSRYETTVLRTNNAAQSILPILFFVLSIMIAMAAILIMSFTSSDQLEVINSVIMLLSADNSKLGKDLEKFVTVLRANLLPIVGITHVFYGVLLNLVNLYIATYFAKKTKYIKYLLEDWPATLRMPIEAFILLIFCFSIVWFCQDKTLYFCALIISMSLLISFFISGCAFIHFMTRKLPYRFLIMTFFYTGLFTLLQVPFLVSLIGIFAAFHFAYKNSSILYS